jgi:hypothetical protein
MEAVDRQTNELAREGNSRLLNEFERAAVLLVLNGEAFVDQCPKDMRFDFTPDGRLRFVVKEEGRQSGASEPGDIQSIVTGRVETVVKEECGYYHAGRWYVNQGNNLLRTEVAEGNFQLLPNPKMPFEYRLATICDVFVLNGLPEPSQITAGFAPEDFLTYGLDLQDGANWENVSPTILDRNGGIARKGAFRLTTAAKSKLEQIEADIKTELEEAAIQFLKGGLTKVRVGTFDCVASKKGFTIVFPRAGAFPDHEHDRFYPGIRSVGLRTEGCLTDMSRAAMQFDSLAAIQEDPSLLRSSLSRAVPYQKR